MHHRIIDGTHETSNVYSGGRSRFSIGMETLCSQYTVLYTFHQSDTSIRRCNSPSIAHGHVGRTGGGGGLSSKFRRDTRSGGTLQRKEGGVQSGTGSFRSCLFIALSQVPSPGGQRCIGGSIERGRTRVHGIRATIGNERELLYGTARGCIYERMSQSSRVRGGGEDGWGEEKDCHDEEGCRARGSERWRWQQRGRRTACMEERRD
mmetsp:Transcript_25195/g.73981  ORF Transcript_25195/g.73981 Transcript_25195/m.73981 type:complete len:206 (+) Transcript_25195:3780-4397(+)